MPTIEARKPQLVTVAIDGKIVLSAELINCRISRELEMPGGLVDLAFAPVTPLSRIVHLSLEAFELAQVLPACSRPGAARKPIRGGGITC